MLVAGSAPEGAAARESAPSETGDRGSWPTRILPYLVALFGFTITVLVVRPNMWLALQGDSAFYQSLSENGSAPARAGQDLIYFPQRLSLLVPQRFAVLAFGVESGYLVFRYAMAAAVTCLCVYSIPRRKRLMVSGLVGVVCATTPPAIGWLSQNYPTVFTGPALAVAAVATVRMWTGGSAREFGVIGAVLGLVAACLVHGHWGTAVLGLPVFGVAGILLLTASRRTRILPFSAGFAVGFVVLFAALSLAGLVMFDFGTPAQIWDVNMRGADQISNVQQSWAGYDNWAWVWWQTTVVLWVMAMLLPFVLRARNGSWDSAANLLAIMFAGQVGLAALRDPILYLSNTQYTPQIWPLALLGITRAVALIAAGPDKPDRAPNGPWPAVGGIMLVALAGAWSGVTIGRGSGLSLGAALVIGLAVLLVLSLIPLLIRRSAARSVESAVAAGVLVFAVFLIGSAQTIPEGVRPQAPSPGYPELSPQAWIDYTLAYGPSPSHDSNRSTYLAASVISSTAYSHCPDGALVQYWLSGPRDAYLAWSIFAPYNTASEPFPIVPQTDQTLCLIPIGAVDIYTSAGPVDPDQASMIVEVPIEQYPRPDGGIDIVRVYVTTGTP